jgi:hypothetical protein
MGCPCQDQVRVSRQAQGRQRCTCLMKRLCARCRLLLHPGQHSHCPRESVCNQHPAASLSVGLRTAPAWRDKPNMHTQPTTRMPCHRVPLTISISPSGRYVGPLCPSSTPHQELAMMPRPAPSCSCAAALPTTLSLHAAAHGDRLAATAQYQAQARVHDSFLQATCVP